MSEFLMFQSLKGEIKEQWEEIRPTQSYNELQTIHKGTHLEHIARELSRPNGGEMTEKVLIFIIVGSVIVAVTLIAAIMQIVKAICEAQSCKYSAISMELLHEMKEELLTGGECNGN